MQLSSRVSIFIDEELTLCLFCLFLSLSFSCQSYFLARRTFIPWDAVHWRVMFITFLKVSLLYTTVSWRFLALGAMIPMMKGYQ